jgi:hypothetical protein
MGVSRSSRIVAALAMAVLVAGCGGSDGGVSSTDETVATGGPGVSPATGAYSGKTSQGLPITFTVSPGGTISVVRFGWRARCEDGKVHTNTILLDGGPIRDRDFSVQGTLETGGVAGVRGRFEDGTASGTLWRAKGSAFGTNCVAKGIGWHALVDAGGSVPGAV